MITGYFCTMCEKKPTHSTVLFADGYHNRIPGIRLLKLRDYLLIFGIERGPTVIYCSNIIKLLTSFHLKPMFRRG